MKLKYGNAYIDPSKDEEETPNYAIDGKCSIEAHLLEDIVEARVNEILANVWNQIVLSGYDDKLLAGAIVTGGAANLKNMEEAFSKRTKLEKVRMAKDSQLSLKGGIELKKTECPTPSLHCWLPEKKTVIALNIRENRLSPFKPDSLPKKEKVQKKKKKTGTGS